MHWTHLGGRRHGIEQARGPAVHVHHEVADGVVQVADVMQGLTDQIAQALTSLDFWILCRRWNDVR